MSLSQNDMGRAFEYGIACSISELIQARQEQNELLQKVKECFERCSKAEQESITQAAKEAAVFLIARDIRLSEKNCSIYLQSDQKGELGDVRDIVIHNTLLKEDIGISAKNRHWAVKHSRLSEQIDFSFVWFGIHCSKEYLNSITPIFEELKKRKNRNETWLSIPNKKQLFYLPILQAFQKEIKKLFRKDPATAAKALVKYLLGKFDYYKVIKENGMVAIISFNLDGTLKWGSQLLLPTRLIEISLKPNSDTTLIMVFDRGWQISFRIHNASTMVEPSLKFDINIIGQPQNISRHVISYDGKKTHKSID